MLSQIDIELTEADFQQLATLVHKHCGINLHDGKRELVRARIAKQMRLGGFQTARQYIDHVLADASGKAFTTMIDSLSTNLTSFFRESDHFDYLANKFMPALCQRKRGRQDNRIRGWSAACSTGEEPYTMGMTILDALAALPPGGGSAAWDVKLLATDISTKVLNIAEIGMYEAQRAQAIPPEKRGKYLCANRIDGKTVFAIAPAVKQLVRFRHLNLVETWPFAGPFDFIFCRNVMIYFDKPTQQALVNRFWEILDGGGLLFTGHSESLTGIVHKFKYVQPTIYAKG